MIGSFGDAMASIQYAQLGLHPVALDFGVLQIRWYSLAYIAGILLGWWYILRLLATPGAPMARRHADDLVTWVTLGIILGGRLAYVLFYDLQRYIANPGDILRLWEGGMSFHGGAVGVGLATLIYAWKHKLSWLRMMDYISCVAPIGLGMGRIANFINGELWGSVTAMPWGVVFPDGGPLPRHPSQLYEAGLEGGGLFLLLWWLFHRTQARYEPGRLMGAFLLGYGVIRFLLEFIREPDAQLTAFAQATGLHMGQWLCVPMVLGGGWLIATAKRRRVRVEPIAGTQHQA